MFSSRERLALVALALVTPGCLPQGLAFVKDDRVEIVSPEGHKKVALPVTVDWDVERFDISGPNGVASEDAGYFGVFVDTAPVPPGKPLSWVAHNDRICVNTPGCPDDQYLADRGVYDTTDTSFTFKRLPDMDAYQGHEVHEITVILLDGTGHRLGESAWYVTFYYDREV